MKNTTLLTNRIKSINFLFLLLTFFLISCSKNENPEPIGPNAINYRVKEVRDASNILISNFTYNNQNLVTKLTTSDGSSVFTYNAAGYLLKEEFTSVSSPNNDYIINYILGANNAVNEKIKTINTTGQKTKEVFVNNAAKLPISLRHYDYANPTWVFDELKNEDYVYDAQNRVIVTNTYNYHYEYAYDANSNLIEQKKFNGRGIIQDPYLLVEKIETTFNNIKPKYYLNSRLSKNSPLTVKTSIYDDGDFRSTTTDVYKYDFNSSNYITRSYYNNNLEFNYTLEQF